MTGPFPVFGKVDEFRGGARSGRRRENPGSTRHPVTSSVELNDPRKRVEMKFLEGKSLRAVKKFFVAIIGFTLLIVGAAMIVLPGPALIIIPLGLAILATEFLWARRVLQRLKNVLKEGREKIHRTEGRFSGRKEGR